MSSIAGAEPLPGHDHGLPSYHNIRNRRDRFSFCKMWSTYNTVSIATVILLPLIILVVLYLIWLLQLPAQGSAIDLVGHVDGVVATVTASSRNLKRVLYSEEHVSREPGTRSFSWNISKAVIAPNGVRKNVFLVDGHFPGPIIEARSGDILEIEVYNHAGEDISLHWHGLHMKGANNMDGPVGITQCAIKHGQNSTYQVLIDNQAGTFWYHAHSEVQRADGLYGGLVVHDPAIPLQNSSYEYDEELLFLVGDWYHWPGARVLANFMDRTSTGSEPCPDSLLINGLGYFQCSAATHGAPVNCSDVKKPWMSLDKRIRYRIRLINVGSLTGITFSIPDSEIKVIQIDGGMPITSNVKSVNSIGVLYPAERVDFILSWEVTAVNSNTEVIMELDDENFLRPNFALTPTQSFGISAGSSPPEPPSTNLGIRHFDLAYAEGVALTAPLPEPVKTFMVYTSIEILNRLGSRPHGFINHTTSEPQSIPLISLNRSSWNEHQLVPWTGSEPVWVELTINNLDTAGHPFHLHGFDFYIIASYEGKGGWDYYNPFEPSRPPRGGPFNLFNPLKKDTVYVPPWGYVVIRFLADNVGIWTLHCHILWHAASGMSMAFQVMGDEAMGWSESDEGLRALEMCGI